MAGEAEVSAGGAAALTRGFPGVDNAPRAERLARRAALKPRDVERAVLLICAELTGLVPDRELFAHEWPLRLETAYMFKLESESSEASPDGRVFGGFFAGRSRDRDAVLAALSALRGGLPVVWTTVASGGLDAAVTVAKLEAAGASVLGRRTEAGGRVFTIETRLVAHVRTAAPRGC